MWFNVVRHRLGFPYWPLSAYLKHKVKNAVGYIGNYENAVVAEARRRGVDGGMCGPHRRIGKTDFSSAFKAVTADKISSQKGNPTFIWTLSWSYRQQSVWSKRIWVRVLLREPQPCRRDLYDARRADYGHRMNDDPRRRLSPLATSAPVFLFHASPRGRSGLSVIGPANWSASDRRPQEGRTCVFTRWKKRSC